MAVSMAAQMMAALPQLRFQSTPKRVRARRGDVVVADTTDAVLVWEPTRIVPSYAVPAADLRVPLQPAAPGPAPSYRPVGFGADSPPLLDPSIPFAVHTADGEPCIVAVAPGDVAADAFRLADPGLDTYVVLDFEAFEWWEEDEQIVGHPRDPFHRIDVRASSRSVRLEHDGRVLAASDRTHMLFEGAFPMPRYYLPAADVLVELRPSTLRTTCAYKGEATHHTAVVGDEELTDIAWSYEDPLDDATQVAGLVCFYQERLDLVVDGVDVPRVRTPWS